MLLHFQPAHVSASASQLAFDYPIVGGKRSVFALNQSAEQAFYFKVASSLLSTLLLQSAGGHPLRNLFNKIMHIIVASLSK